LKITGLLEWAFFPMLFQKRRLTELQRKGLTLGKRVYVHPSVVFDNDFPWLISLEDDCTLSVNVIVLAHDASPQIHLGYVRIGKVTVGAGAFVGAGSVILPGVTIGKRAIVGAGSVVTRSVPENCVYAGNPARLIEPTPKFVEKHREKLTLIPTLMGNKSLNTLENQEIIKKALEKGSYYVKPFEDILY
jgi:maltose O-acetyltransferase